MLDNHLADSSGRAGSSVWDKLQIGLSSAEGAEYDTIEGS
jgi:hypothetical protein